MQTPVESVGAAYAQLRPPMIAYLRRQVRDPAVAEDLVQQVFIKALTALKAGRVVGNLPGWLYQVARNAAIDYHREQRPQGTTASEDTVTDVNDDDRLHQQLATCLRPIVDTLPALYRDTLVATDIEGRSLRGIAATAGLSVSAIKSRVSRGRRLLKAKLLECCSVEVTNGTVTDYQRRGATHCGGRCG
jgi:RNA polymerase sigma-70 factor, ECF subfamily